MKLRSRSEPVLDERELQEMYRIEHRGLWLMYALLVAAVLVQLLMGAGLAQMAGELVVILVASVAMIAANTVHGIWELRARPSVRGNAATALSAGVAVGLIVALMKGGAVYGLAAGAAMAVLCFALLSALMACIQWVRARRERDLDDE